jgi:hypothetical protein
VWDFFDSDICSSDVLEEVHHDQLLSEGQRFEIEFKNKMKQEAGVAWSRKRKTIQ